MAGLKLICMTISTDNESANTPVSTSPESAEPIRAVSPTGPDEPQEKLTAGKFTMNVLNGISIAVVVALVPQALLGEIFTALLPVFPQGQTLINMVSLSSAMLPILIGVMVGLQFKLSPIQTACVGLASVLGSGVATPQEAGGFIVKGTGLVLNSGLTAAIAVGLLLLIGHRLGSYTVLFLSTITVVIAGGIGWIVTYPIVKQLTAWIGSLVNGAADLQPIVMGIVLSVVFCVMIVSPVSTVGLATAIMMTGVSSGTANLGVVAAGFGLCITGWKANGPGKSLLPLLGSPKVQMANVWGRPLNFLPILSTAAVLGALGGIFKISGTPISAGFGISGLVGPLAALNYEGWGWTTSNITIVVGVFIIAPIFFSVFFSWLYSKLGWVKPEHFRLDFE